MPNRLRDAVVQLFEALRYKPEGRGFYSRLCPSGRTVALGSTQPLKEMSTTNISWRGKGGRCVGLTNLTLSCIDCLEIWEPQPPGTLRVCPGLYLYLLSHRFLKLSWTPYFTTVCQSGQRCRRRKQAAVQRLYLYANAHEGINQTTQTFINTAAGTTNLRTLYFGESLSFTGRTIDYLEELYTIVNRAVGVFGCPLVCSLC
jgi:hypothetical protein